VFGRKAGTAEGFHRYSDALKSADLVWNEDTLNTFLADPQAFLPGNRMTFPGLADAQARADVITYLQTATATEAQAEAGEQGGMRAAPQLLDLRRELGPNNRITSIRYCGELADQLRLVEAIALALGREVGQPVRGQSRFGALPGLPLDRFDPAPCRRLGRCHAGCRQRLHRHRETVRQRDLVRLRSLSEVDHDRTSTELRASRRRKLCIMRRLTRRGRW
jgi:hypothetical protein